MSDQAAKARRGGKILLISAIGFALLYGNPLVSVGGVLLGLLDQDSG